MIRTSKDTIFAIDDGEHLRAALLLRVPSREGITFPRGLGQHPDGLAFRHGNPLVGGDFSLDENRLVEDLFPVGGIVGGKGFPDRQDDSAEVRVVGFRPLRGLDNQVGRPDPGGRHGCDIGFPEGEGLEGSGNVDTGVFLEELLPGGLEIVSFNQFVGPCTCIGGLEQDRTLRMGDRVSDDPEFHHPEGR